MGYTKIIGTPVIAWLYTLFLPVVVFAVFGSRRCRSLAHRRSFPVKLAEPGMVILWFGADLFYANVAFFAERARTLVHESPTPCAGSLLMPPLSPD
jgi:MFS superfamily sulfate permease-like transporter